MKKNLIISRLTLFFSFILCSLFLLGHDYFQARPRPSSGSSVTYIGRGTGSADGQMRNPMGIALDSAGNLYVSDYQNKRIQKFDLNGHFVAIRK